MIFMDMQNVPIVDLAYSLEFVHILGDERKIQRYLSRMMDTIEVTNPSLLKQVYNQEALIDILRFYR